MHQYRTQTKLKQLQAPKLNRQITKNKGIPAIATVQCLAPLRRNRQSSDHYAQSMKYLVAAPDEHGSAHKETQDKLYNARSAPHQRTWHGNRRTTQCSQVTCPIYARLTLQLGDATINAAIVADDFLLNVFMVEHVVLLVRSNDVRLGIHGIMQILGSFFGAVHHLSGRVRGLPLADKRILVPAFFLMPR